MNKRIGLIIPEISDALEYDLIEGMYAKAKEKNCDLLVLTGVFNSHQEFQQDSYISCLENIYELIEYGRFDGFVFAAGRFNNLLVRDKIYSMLIKRELPCIVLDDSNEYFLSIYPDQRESIKMITKHLINEHGCKKIYCITGIEGNYDSIERLEGFRDALLETGVECSENCIFYGGFWKDIPADIARKIASGELEMPDAVVCASDVMAIALCDALIECGLRVPEDIAVTGYDGGWEAYSYKPEITTVYGREYEFGIRAMNRILAEINGCAPEKTDLYQHIRYGKSCGCGETDHLAEKTHDTSMTCFVKKKINLMIERKTYMASDMNFNLNKCSSLDELSMGIHNYGHLLSSWKWIDICLCEDWQIDPEAPETYRRSGFTDTMFLAVSKRFEMDKREKYSFKTSELLPALGEEHEPLIVVFSSLFCNDQIFGYIGISYKNADDMCIDTNYLRWCDSFCNGLRLLRGRLYAEYYKNQIAALSTRDPATGLLNKRGLLEKIPEYTSRSGLKLKKKYLLMLSNIEHETANEKVIISDSQTIANAVRMSSDETEICARLSDNIFIIIMAADEKSSLNDSVQNRLLRLEEEFSSLYGNAADVKFPEFITEAYEITGSSPIELDKLIDGILINLSENSKAAANRYYDYREQLNQLRRELYINPQADWNIEDMAAKIGLSRSYLQRMYKSQFAVSCHDDIINARMEKAKRLLVNSKLRIQEIADLCGYSNSSHFMKQFKMRCGVTAKQFRTDNT